MALILASLAVASIVNLWLRGTLFHETRGWLAARQNHPRFLLRWFAKGALCHFCVSVWVAIAIGLGLWFAPEVTGVVTLAAAAAYLGQLGLVLYAALGDKLPQWIELSLAMKTREAEQCGAIQVRRDRAA